MTSLERFEAAMKLEAPDRVPVFYFEFGGATHILTDLGYTMEEAYTDSNKLAHTCMRAQKVYHNDNVMAGWGDASVESHALGSIWKWRGPYVYPRITEFAVKCPDDAFMLEPTDPHEDYMMDKIIEGLRIVKEKVGDKIAVLGFMNSPFAVAAELAPYEKFLTWLIFNPRCAHKMLDVITSMEIEYIKVMIEESGVHGICIEDGWVGAESLSMSMATEFDIKYVKSLADETKKKGAYVVIHNCSSDPYLDLQIGLRPHAIHYWAPANLTWTMPELGDPKKVDKKIAFKRRVDDWIPEMKALKEKYGNRVCIITGIDNMKTVLFGSPRDVEEEGKKAIEVFREGGFMLCGGCEIPLNAPIENILAIARASVKYSEELF